MVATMGISYFHLESQYWFRLQSDFIESCLNVNIEIGVLSITIGKRRRKAN